MSGAGLLLIFYDTKNESGAVYFLAIPERGKGFGKHSAVSLFLGIPTRRP